MRPVSSQIRDISIHAPVKGATVSTTASRHTQEISIHAPVKGATRSGRPAPAQWWYFNPRSREGSDGTGVHYPWLRRISIHAPVKGATPHRVAGQSRAHISIHAPVKGATGSMPALVSRALFQSTLP